MKVCGTNKYTTGLRRFYLCKKEGECMPKKWTQETFVERIHSLNPNIEILSQISTCKSRVSCRCKTCGYTWSSVGSELLVGSGCRVCNYKRGLENRKGKTKRKTNEEFIALIKKTLPDIEVISEYKAQRFKVKCWCLIDGYEWEAYPQNLERGHGCSKCAARKASKRMTISNDVFKTRVHNLNPNIIFNDIYYGNTTRIDCLCSDCGHKWNTAASQLLAGCNCQRCAAKIRAKEYNLISNEEFTNKLHRVNQNIEPLEEYKGYNIKILCKCLTCGHKWSALPHNLLKNEGCPKCYISHGEEAIATYLDSENIKYDIQYRFEKCRYIRPLPFDFYLPDYNTCIEYDGQQHYWPIDFAGHGEADAQEAFDKVLTRDSIKTEFCESNNISLLRIPYWEQNNISNIISNFLHK